MSRRSIGLAMLVLIALTATVAGCGRPAIQKVDANTAVGMLGSHVVIDVRTPAEYAAVHVAGARNIDVEAPDFGAKISSLDKRAAYLVYCHSGRRSAIAAEQMAAAGFTDITDGGALADLLGAGAPSE